MNKVFYWSPFISKVATVKSVLNSAEAINKSFKNKLVMRYCRELSKDISIPEKEIIFYFKKKLFDSYDFKKNRFTKTILYPMR